MAVGVAAADAPNARRDVSSHTGGVALNQGSFSDFMSFRTLISTSWIKFVYALGAIGITLASGNMIFSGGQQAGGPAVLAGLVYLVAGNIGWRVVCEAAILFFSMHEQLVTLVKASSGRSQPPSGMQTASPSPPFTPAYSASVPAAPVAAATRVCQFCGERTSAVGKSCRFCGQPFESGAKSGAPLPKVPSAACPSCGAELPAGTVYHRCWKCDAPLR
jgi:hypothetical protein